MLNSERLREVLDYDPETGLFAWRVKTCRKVVPGTKAGGIGQHGYVDIGVDGKVYRAHRLAFLWMEGEWSEHHVDHIDRDRANNAWLNLRKASSVLNGHNRGVHKRNTSGFPGVSLHRQTGKWRAQISVNRTPRSLGLFHNPEQAAEAYRKAKAEVMSCL